MPHTRESDNRVYKSPGLLTKSPKYTDTITNLLFSKSPSIKSVHSPHDGYNILLRGDDDLVPEDQIYKEVADIIVNEEINVWIKGLLLLAGTVLFWVASVQLMNMVMKKTDYDHPLLAAYLNGSCFLLFGLMPLCKEWLKDDRRKIDARLFTSDSNGTPSYMDPEIDSSFAPSSEDSIFENLNIPRVQLSHREIVTVAMCSAGFYFTSCFLGSSALKYTSASNATILSTASSVFSLIIGVMFKVETFTPGKVISVLCSIAGILLITLSSASHEALSATTIKTSVISGEIYGDLLSTAGAFSYSCFLVLLRIKLGGQTDSKNDSLLYGYLGLTILVIGIPLLLVFDVLNWEELSLPEHMSTLVMMVLASLFNAISDLCGSKASLITSPLSVSLSLAVGIPISMILDAIFYGGMSITPSYLLGIICILVSFIFNSLADEKKIVETAIENAIEEAIYHDESLSVLLTPKLRSTHSTDFEQYRIPDLSISAVISEPIHQQRLVVTGGENHKYFFREIRD